MSKKLPHPLNTLEAIYVDLETIYAELETIYAVKRLLVACLIIVEGYDCSCGWSHCAPIFHVVAYDAISSKRFLPARNEGGRRQ
jgi:hypothetical protein